MNLSILIPTYDRPNEVGRCLLEIAGQFPRSTPIHIQVNPGLYSSRDIRVPPGLSNVFMRQNSSNIGFVANVVSGLQHIDSEWIWILGDDDYIAAGTHDVICASIVNQPCLSQFLLFNQWRQPKDNHITLCSNLEDFVSLTDFGDCLFMSALIWRTSFFRSNLGTFIDYSFTRASQAVIQLSSLADTLASCSIVNTSLFTYVSPASWSRLDYLQRVDKILLSPSLVNYASLIYPFMRPQVGWAIRSSFLELSTLRDFVLWSALAFRYSRLSLRYDKIHVSLSTILGHFRFCAGVISNRLRKNLKKLVLLVSGNN